MNELFDAALPLSGQRRREFLRQVCPDDPELRKEVEDLLHYAGDESFLQEPPIAEGRANALAPGKKLGSFEIVALLGKGGMGEVYRARDLRLEREVAIKILPPDLAHNAERALRFEREAKAASALNHPNILSVYDIGREGGLSWMVCELVEGQSLRQLLTGQPMPLGTAVGIAGQIADALAAAHTAGVVHRDLKPENVMLTRDERVKILDFGLAKWNPPGASGPSDVPSETGTIVGTPYVMSPEQVVGSPVDNRSDIFSLGTLLFEMLAGKPPFSGDSSAAVMNTIVHGNPEDLPATVPDTVASIVHRCLAKSPERRFQSAADLAFALRLAGARNIDGTTAPKPPQRRWWITAAAVLMLALAAAAGWLYRQGRPTTASPSAGNLRRLTWYEGLTTDAAISTDGKLVAYASDWGNQGNLDIYVQQVDGRGTLRLTSDRSDEFEPTFTPNGEAVVFESSREGGGIYEVPSLGGEKSLLVAGGRHPRVSPDGRFLLYTTGELTRFRSARYNNLGRQLYVRALVCGEPALISRGCAAVLSLGVWSPDSQYVLFSAHCSGHEGVWLARRDGTGSLRPIDLEVFRLSNGLRSPAGLHPVFDQWLTNPSRLLLPVVDRDTAYEAILPISDDGTRVLGPLQRLTFGPHSTAQASASVSGRLALSSAKHSSNLWRLVVDDAGHAKGAPVQITTEQSMCINPILSTDGQHVAFVSIYGSGVLGADLSTSMAGAYQLRVMSLANGIATTAHLSENEMIFYPLFSTDNRLTYLSATKMGPEGPETAATFEVGAQGGGERKILPEEAGLVTDWARDGSFCITAKGYLRPHMTVSMVDRRSVREVRILEDPHGSLFEAKLSHDGKWLTFMAVRNQRSAIYIAPFRGEPVPMREWIALTDGATWDDKPRLSLDDQLLFFISDRDGYRCIWVQPLRSDKHPKGAPQAVYHFHSAKRSLAQKNLAYLGLAVGRDVLVFNQGETTGDIWLLDPIGTAKQ